MSEEWREVPGFPNYSASTSGDVRHNVRGLLHPWKSSYGYLFVKLYITSRKACTIQVHRVITATFLGPRPINQEPNHINGVKHDNRLENLEYVTRQENMKHAVRLGLVKPPSTKGRKWQPPAGWVKSGAEFTCEYCKVKFFDVPSSKRRFCSRDCRYAAGREATHIKAVCPICSGEFEYLRSWPKTYCSKVCAGKATYHHLGKHARAL